MKSEIFHKNELERYGLAKSKQVEGATVNIKGETWKIMHICHNKDYRVAVCMMHVTCRRGEMNDS